MSICGARLRNASNALTLRRTETCTFSSQSEGKEVGRKHREKKSVTATQNRQTDSENGGCRRSSIASHSISAAAAASSMPVNPSLRHDATRCCCELPSFSHDMHRIPCSDASTPGNQRMWRETKLWCRQKANKRRLTTRIPTAAIRAVASIPHTAWAQFPLDDLPTSK